MTMLRPSGYRTDLDQNGSSLHRRGHSQGCYPQSQWSSNSVTADIAALGYCDRFGSWVAEELAKKKRNVGGCSR